MTFAVINHGVDTLLVARQFEKAREFFSLPDAEKNKVAVSVKLWC